MDIQNGDTPLPSLPNDFGQQVAAASEIGYFEAGEIAARELMRTVGLPLAREIFSSQCPDCRDPDSITASGRPLEFWTGMFTELRSVGGTA